MSVYVLRPAYRHPERLDGVLMAVEKILTEEPAHEIDGDAVCWCPLCDLRFQFDALGLEWKR